MLRAVLTVGGTVAGLAALMSFKTHAATTAADATSAAPPPATITTAPPAASAPKPSASAPARPAGRGNTAGTGSTGTGSAAGGSAGGTRTVTGKVASTQYGPMQVAVTLAGQRITKVAILQQTNSGSLSSQIDAMAIPKLTSETLAAQSARIDAVSGASYTSSGYIQSLQSALDQAHA